LSGGIKPVSYEEISILAPCLKSLSENYFKSRRASRGSLVVINLVPHPKSFLQRRILQALNEDKKHALGLMVKDARIEHKNASRVTDRAKNYMLLMLTLADLKVTILQWKSLPTWNPLAQTVIMFMEPMINETHKDEEVKVVFEELLKYGMIYAIAIFQMESNPYKMIAETWFPYENNSCAKSIDNIHKIHECTVFNPNESHNTTEKSVHEYEEYKIQKIPISLHDCPLEVSTFIWEPVKL
jgi:hypothetical protein